MSRVEFERSDLAIEIETVLPASDGRIVVSEAHLLFDAQFERLGSDLYLVNEGFAHLRVENYFSDAQPADIFAPDGAVLRGDLVLRMAGPLAPGQYAQTGPLVGASPIGQVETLSGGATVQRTDGTAETLQVGMKIFQNDVIQTEADGVMSVTFVDGTIFTLAAGSRMIIDELIYEPEGAANAGSFSLIQGGFVFIAGQIAKTGEMDVNTPSSTMGIRGTTVLVDIQTDNGIVTSEVTLTRDPDGGIGEVVLRDVNGQLIANITETNTKWIISAADGDTREEFRTALDDADDNVMIAEAFAAYHSAFSRVDNGDTFVTLGDPSGQSVTDSPNGPDGTNLELDSIDEPDNIDADDSEGPLAPQEDGGSFEEGRLNSDDEINSVDVSFAGREDAAVSGAITGVIPQNQADSSTVVFELGTAPENGTASVSTDGRFNYVPDKNYNGDDSFTYRAIDAEGEIVVGTVTIEVSSVNDAPKLAAIQANVLEDSVVSGVVVGTDVDGDSLRYTLVTGAGNGQVVLLQNGAFTYAPDPDFDGTDSFLVRVSDGSGGSAVAAVNIVVAGINDPPEFTSGPGQTVGSVLENSVVDTVSGALTATDAEAGSTLTWGGSQNGTYGRFEISDTGVWNFKLDAAAADSLSRNELATEYFVATVTDDEGATTEQLVTVKIEGANDAALISGDVTGNLVEDAAVIAISGDLAHTDVDNNNVADRFRAQPAGTTSDKGYGSYEVNTAGIWVYTLNNAHATVTALAPGDSLSDSFTVRSGDGTPQVVTVTIDGANDSPKITTAPGAGRGSVLEGSEVTNASGQLSAHDPDTGIALVWSGSASGVYGAFALDPDGSWTYTLDNSLADVLSEGQVVTENFAVTVTDDLGATANQIVVVTITGTNDVPVIGKNITVETARNEAYEGILTATDVDGTGALTFSAGVNGPANGHLSINPDGTYLYTPDTGFQGVDQFEFLVTDSDGGVRTGTVTVEVESAVGTGTGGQTVSLSINTVATVEAPAGSVSILASPVDSTSVNLVIAMDRSGSIGRSGWATQTEAVADALDTLAAQFSASTTSVDVKIITYATGVRVLDTFDLQDPDLSNTVRTLPYTGGRTNWTMALSEVESFLDTQPTDESNFLFFITDGNPTSGGWQSSLADLTDVAANGYTVNIEAFGIGSFYNLATLSQIDPTPTQLASADDLAEALTATPIFDPRLLSFDLTLEVDGVNHGVVADETSPVLINDGLNYQFSLAEIVDIETLLGENNRFSATVQFDLDGDESTAEIELFSTESISISETAQVLSGMDESDLLLGSDLNDQIDGNGGNDVILGFGGNDELNGGSGSNIVLGGGGDDTIHVSGLPTGSGGLLDGGEGRDILAFEFAGDIDGDLLAVLSVADIEAINVENGLSNTLSLTLADVINLSGTADTELEALLGTALPESAVIHGDVGDTLVLSNGPDGAFEQVPGDPVVDSSGQSLSIFQYVQGGNVLATLGVDTDVTVNTVPVA